MKKAYLHTFGCKVNQYETQLLREQFASQGYADGRAIGDADLVVINTCSVTAEAERQCRQLIRQILKQNSRCTILVTGCYAVRTASELRELSPRVNVQAKDSLLTATSISSFNGHTRAFVKVQDGCDAFCSYCIIPIVRPTLWSRRKQDIITEIQRLSESGYPEIVLTGIRLGKFEGGLVGLLRSLVNLSGKFRLRLSSLELKEVTDEILDLMRSHRDRICAHLHIPLQSASDPVLRRMNRPYTREEFESRLEAVYVALPEAGITTDVIVGFPGETDDDFRQTYGFLKKHKFSRLHVFTYSERPGTRALQFHDKVPRETAKQRSLLLKELDKGLQEAFWRSFIGKIRPAIREGEKKMAITDNYIRVALPEVSHSFSNSIFNLTITASNGKPAGTPLL